MMRMQEGQMYGPGGVTGIPNMDRGSGACAARIFQPYTNEEPFDMPSSLVVKGTLERSNLLAYGN